jgi:hypothetical protein
VIVLFRCLGWIAVRGIREELDVMVWWFCCMLLCCISYLFMLGWVVDTILKTVLARAWTKGVEG